eukprot:1289898-Pyramimonas_sp.AAC.1
MAIRIILAHYWIRLYWNAIGTLLRSDWIPLEPCCSGIRLECYCVLVGILRTGIRLDWTPIGILYRDPFGILLYLNPFGASLGPYRNPISELCWNHSALEYYWNIMGILS